MFKQLAIASAVSVAVVLSMSGCEISINDDSVKGSGKIISETRTAGSLTPLPTTLLLMLT